MGLRFLMFGILGIFAEVAFTGLAAAVTKRDRSLTGESSLLMLPIYGLIAVLFPLIAIHLGTFPWWGRGLVYMLAFFVVEYLTGLGLTRLGVCPWKYSSKYAINGLISLPYAPVWFLAGLGVEWIYPWIKAMSIV